jgi:hypothetical protein
VIVRDEEGGRRVEMVESRKVSDEGSSKGKGVIRKGQEQEEGARGVVVIFEGRSKSPPGFLTSER